MKNLLIISFVLISLFIICTNDHNSINTQVIITIPDLTSEDLYYLNNEFNRHSNIYFVEGSTESNTIALNVDVNSFNQKKIENMLNKWNCEAVNFDYNNLSDIAYIE